MKSDATVSPPCIGLRAPEAAAALGISPRKLSSLTADRASGIPFAKLGGVVVYPVRELQDWLAVRAKGGDACR